MILITAEADRDVELSIIAATCLVVAVMCGLATRNLYEMSRHIREHNKASMDRFNQIDKALQSIRDAITRWTGH